MRTILYTADGGGVRSSEIRGRVLVRAVRERERKREREKENPSLHVQPETLAPANGLQTSLNSGAVAWTRMVGGKKVNACFRIRRLMY